MWSIADGLVGPDRQCIVFKRCLVPDTNITLGGSGASRTVQVTPISGQKGSAVIKLLVTDAFGARAEGDPSSACSTPPRRTMASNSRVAFDVLDSGAGTTIAGVPMRDGNVRNKTFVDGYVLRTEWATLEPTAGVFDFTIIDNILVQARSLQSKALA